MGLISSFSRRNLEFLSTSMSDERRSRTTREHSQRYARSCVCIRTSTRRDSHFELAWASRAAAASEDCRAVAGTKRLSNATAGCETAHTWRLKDIGKCQNRTSKDKASAAPQSRVFWWIPLQADHEPRRGAKLPACPPVWSGEGSGTGLIAPHLRWRRVKFTPKEILP